MKIELYIYGFTAGAKPFEDILWYTETNPSLSEWIYFVRHIIREQVIGNGRNTAYKYTILKRTQEGEDGK